MNIQNKFDAPTPAILDSTVKQMLHLAKQAGAQQAEVMVITSRNISVSVRDNEIEEVESSESQDLGLRVLIGKKQSCVSTSDLSAVSLEKMAERVCAMAKEAPDDPYCGLATPEQLQTSDKDLQKFDPSTVDMQQLIERAKEGEAAALAIAGVNLPATASASFSLGSVCHRASNGLHRASTNSFHGQSVLAFAEKNGAMERDWAQSGACWLEDIRCMQEIGFEAANRAIARLGAKKGAGGTMAVMFEPRTATTFVSMLLGAISGSSVARGVSFLKDKKGQQLFTNSFNIIEDPHRLRGSGSSLIDSEGFMRKPAAIIENGYLNNWLHNLASARQLEETPTAHGATGIGSPPGISSTNVYVTAGSKSPTELMLEVGKGLIVTDAFGASFNSGTGDWSVGVAGFYFEGDNRTTSFSEMTVAGNMLDIFKTIIPASDLKLEQTVETPSLLVPELAVAGQ
ncbi:MAG: TldD/PmbA family protein [Robiginitomaculum sp.]|nr:TldD/PmbA family protein [Robiginitomaculum sp.]